MALTLALTPALPGGAAWAELGRHCRRAAWAVALPLPLVLSGHHCHHCHFCQRANLPHSWV